MGACLLRYIKYLTLSNNLDSVSIGRMLTDSNVSDH